MDSKPSETVLALADAPKDRTWGEFLDLMARAPKPDDRFAAEVEAIQAAQRPATMPEWPDQSELASEPPCNC